MVCDDNISDLTMGMCMCLCKHMHIIIMIHTYICGSHMQVENYTLSGLIR